MLIVLAAVVVVLFTALVVLVRQRQDARRTLVSIGREVGSEALGASLVQQVRGRVDGEASAKATASALQHALDDSPTGVAMLDEHGSIVYTNHTATRHIHAIGDGATLRMRISSVGRQAIAQDAAERLEVDMHDPSRVVLLLTARPVPGEDGAPARATVYIEDMSASRRVDTMRADFVTNAGHELKTPLGAMAILAEALVITTDDVNRSRLAKRLTVEAARMTNVVDDILTLARTQSLTPERAPVEISDVLDDVAGSLMPHAVASDVGIRRGEVVEARVLGDREELASAVRNLVLNAITYTQVKEAGGMVTYRSRVDDGNVFIEIEDTGIGIPAKFLHRVFERFFRVDQARSRQSGGTGLGLSIVRNVAIAHGGRAYVESQVGVGTTFTMRLPIHEDEPG
jgi:two-component system sensor histidine kinase SenX3